MRRWTWARVVGNLISVVILVLVLMFVSSDTFLHAITPPVVQTMSWLTSVVVIWLCGMLGWAALKAHRARNRDLMKSALVGLIFFGLLAVGNADILIMSYAPSNPPPTLAQQHIYVDVIFACGGIAFPLGIGIIAARLLQQRRNQKRLG